MKKKPEESLGNTVFWLMLMDNYSIMNIKKVSAAQVSCAWVPACAHMLIHKFS